MIIVFCNQCGQRIAQAEVDRRKCEPLPEPDPRICEACLHAKIATKVGDEMATSMPPGSNTIRRKTSAANMLPRPVRKEPARTPVIDKAKPIAVIAAGGLLLVVISSAVLLSGPTGEPRIAEVKRDPVVFTERTTDRPSVEVKPAVQSPEVTQASDNQRPKPVETPNPPVVEAPKTVETSNPSIVEAPKPLLEKPKPEASVESSLEKITDVLVLREKIKELGVKAPRDQVRRLSLMPSPEDPELTVYSSKFGKNNPIDNIHADYESKIAMVEDRSELAVRVSGGSDRVACYFKKLGAPFVNRLRVRMRVCHQGLKDLRLSVAAVNSVRFHVDVKAPPEGQWSDVTVDFSAEASKGIKLNNLALQHIEVQGFRKVEKDNGAWLELSKFDLVSGGKP